MFKKCIAVSVVIHIAMLLISSKIFGNRALTKEETFFQIENVFQGSAPIVKTNTTQSPVRIADATRRRHMFPFASAAPAVKPDVANVRVREPEPTPKISPKIEQVVVATVPIKTNQNATVDSVEENSSKNTSTNHETKVDESVNTIVGKSVSSSGGETTGTIVDKNTNKKDSDANSPMASNPTVNGNPGVGSVAKPNMGNPNANPVKDPTVKDAPPQLSVRPHPVPVFSPKQNYPLIAQKNNWEGIVKLMAMVKPDGTVGEIIVIQSSGFKVLDQEAIRTFKTWLFSPALKDGIPVTEPYQRPFTFRLTSGGKP